MKKKIKAKYIIGHENGKTVVYEDGELLYDDGSGVILEAGLKVKGDWDREEDLGLSVVSPGFIDLDALGDIDHELFFAEQGGKGKYYWSPEYMVKGPSEAMTAQEEAFKSLYAYSQLISHGITTAMPITCVYYKKAAQTLEETEAAAEHARRLGLRVYLGPSYISAMHLYAPEEKSGIVVAPMEEEGWKGLERAKKFVLDHKHEDGDLIHPVMVPERVELQTEGILKETKRFAREYGLPVRLHAAQGAFEYGWIRSRHHCSTIQYLDSIGFLDENTLIPHAIYASGFSKLDDRTDRDLEILRDRKTSVIHCPLVYSRSGQALESFGRYRRMGVNMTMGTDTFPPDPFMNIRAGSAMSMHVDGCGPDSYYREFFEAATLGGAKALGREDLGKLAPGCRADFIAVDLGGFSMGTYDDPIRTICTCATGRDVKVSVINGRTVMKDGVIPGLDYPQLQAKAQAYYEKLKKSFRDRSGYVPEGSKPFFETSYPVISKGGEEL